MGELFDTLCKGPVVFIDDEIKNELHIKSLIKEIEDHDLPIIKYKNPEEALAKLSNLLYANFIILD